MAYNPYYHNLPWWGSQNPSYGASEFPEWGSENISGYGDSTGPFDQQPQQVDVGGIANGVTSGLTAGQSFGNPDQFRMNGGNILGAIGSGAATGGPVGAAVAGISSFLKQDQALKRNIENVNTSFDTTNDMYGRPVYNGGQMAQGFNDLRGLNEGIAKARFAPIRVRRLAQLGNKRNELYKNIQAGQQDYNQAETGYRNRMMQMQDYYNRQNDQSRLYNLYR